MTDLSTFKAGIIGWPVSHSRSPLIHNYWLEKHGISSQYGRYPIDPNDDFKAALGHLIAAGWSGANVTVPHKENAYRVSDQLSDTALQLGAVNILRFDNGLIIGDNSDGYGFMANLIAGTSVEDWTGKIINILGAGGAARAIIVALAQAGVGEIRVYNRSRERAEAMGTLASNVLVRDWPARHEALKDCDLLVNTTSLGMVGQPALEIDLGHMQGTVCDIVYAPLETPLLTRARALGLVSIDGLGMLLHQAVPAFEQWFGIRPHVDTALRTLILEDL